MSTSYVNYQGGPQEMVVFSRYAMESLRRTKGWVLFLAIMNYIGAGFILLSAIMMLFVATKVPAGRGAPPFGILAMFYVVFSALALSSGLIMQRYVSAIARVTRTGTTNDLEYAIEAQRKIWQFFGIMTIVILSIYLIVIVIAVAAAARF